MNAQILRFRRWLAIAPVALLVACGGSGGGGGAEPSPPEEPVSSAASEVLAIGTPAPRSTIALPAPAPNVLAVKVNRGPGGTAFNSPFVSLTVCIPGTTTCQSIDHILVDTGSNGLRLNASALRSELKLPSVKGASGTPVGQCMQFATGHTWGAVRSADVQLAGERVSSLSVQVIGDPEKTYSAIPAACGRGWPNTHLDANGILGIGMSKEDCGAVCEKSTTPGIYFTCADTGCTPGLLARQAQVMNPVPLLPIHNNGVALTFADVPAGGTPELAGALVFGIGTHTNNQLKSAQVFPPDDHGFISTTYKGSAFRAFLDTGSNGIFFPDSKLNECGGIYCPLLATELQATLTSSTGATRTVDFTVDSYPRLRPDSVAAKIGGTALLPGTFDWGMPFFFARTVFVAITGAQTPAGAGPYWAF